MIKVKSCGAIILKKEDDVVKALIVKQINDNWSFPKGHVEENETELETAIREVKEETGLDIKITENFRKMITYSPREGVLKDVVFFLAKPLSNEIIIDPYEIKEYKWCTLNELFEMFKYTDYNYLIEEIIEYTKENK